MANAHEYERDYTAYEFHAARAVKTLREREKNPVS